MTSVDNLNQCATCGMWQANVGTQCDTCAMAGPTYAGGKQPDTGPVIDLPTPSPYPWNDRDVALIRATHSIDPLDDGEHGPQRLGERWELANTTCHELCPSWPDRDSMLRSMRAIIKEFGN